jgi:hypothetical protein
MLTYNIAHIKVSASILLEIDQGFLPLGQKEVPSSEPQVFIVGDCFGLLEVH